MKLIIAEKPELARAIADAIPGEKIKKYTYIQVGEYIVTWAAGHLLELKNPEDFNPELKKWNLSDLPIYFENWEHKVSYGKQDLVNNIKELLKDADVVINAGDPDDEGQYLIDEILEYLKYKGKVQRILINDNNTESIKKAFDNIQGNEKFVPLGKAAEARAIADFVVGINLSRFYSLKTKQKLSVGRVQTPTLALVVNRDYEIQNHIKEKYYEFYYNTNLQNESIKLKLQMKKDDSNRLDKIYFEELESKLKGKNETIIVSKKISEVATPLPFNLANLQIEANKKYKYSAQKVQDITQTLREKHKAITYNRSDSEYLSTEHFKEASKLAPIIAQKLSLNLDLDFSEENKSRAFNDENITAHHGIIPTFSGEISSFSKEEREIYELIAKRYLIQFMKKKVIETTTAEMKADENIFKSNSVLVINKGYTEIYEEEKDDDTESILDEVKGLSNVNAGDYSVILDNFTIEERESKAKKKYTEATLLKDMTSISKYVKNEEIKKILKEKDKGKTGENGSIGTPATRASIIQNLFDKGYLIKVNNSIESTDLARKFLEILPEYLKEPDLTAKWWVIQEEIKENKATKDKLLELVLSDIKEVMKIQIKNIEIDNKEVVELVSKTGSKYFKGYFEAKEGTLFQKMRYFKDEISINLEKAKKLFNGEMITYKYKKYKIVWNGNYLNIVQVKDKK